MAKFLAQNHHSTIRVNPAVTNAGVKSSPQPKEESNSGGNRPDMLRPASSAWSVQPGTEANASKIKRDIKSKGGVGALECVFDLRQKLLSTEDERKVVDANGDELPISVQEAVRCRNIVDEVGLLNIICSFKKIQVSKGGKQFDALMYASYGIGLCYVVAGFVSFQAPFDSGLEACLQAESINALRDMRMPTQTGFCSTANCTEIMNATFVKNPIMNATFVKNPWTDDTYSAAQDACDGYLEQNEFWIACSIMIPFAITILTLMHMTSEYDDLVGLLKRNEDSDPMVLTIPKGVIRVFSSLLRIILVMKYQNKYADNSVTYFVDLTLLFVFAEIVDYLLSFIEAPFLNALKGEIKEFDEAYMMMENEFRGFIFEQKEGSRELPKVKLDLNETFICPAYLKNDDGSKGDLAGYYMIAYGGLVPSNIKKRQRRPWKFGSKYSSILNGRWKIHIKKDEKGRLKNYRPFKRCAECEHVIKDVYHCTDMGGDNVLCATCYSKLITESAGKDEEFEATLEGNEFGWKVKYLRSLEKRDPVKEIEPLDILVAY